jgi:hypothetical protein
MGHVLQSRVISDLRWFVRPVRDSIVPLGATDHPTREEERVSLQERKRRIEKIPQKLKQK